MTEPPYDDYRQPRHGALPPPPPSPPGGYPERYPQVIRRPSRPPEPDPQDSPAAEAGGRHARHAAKVAARQERQAGRLAAAEDKAATRKAEQAHRKEIAERVKAERAANPPTGRFPALGVQIMADGSMHTFNGIGGRGRPLGPAAGAVAEVGDERRRHRVSGAVSSSILLGSPVGMLGAVGKKAKASAWVTLADGTFHERKLDGNAEVSRAHREVAKFTAAVMRLG